MTTWVLLRGLMRDSRHWYGFDDLIKEHGIEVLTPDVTGNGTLGDLTSPLTIEEYADDVWRQIDAQVCEDTQCSLIGVSMGGMLALEMAKQRPQKINQVVMINSSAGNVSPWYQRFQVIPLIKAIGRANWRIILDKLRLSRKGRLQRAHLNFVESCTLNYTTMFKGTDELVLADWSLMRRENHTSIVNGARQLLAAAKFSCPKNIAAEVFIIAANQDNLANPKCSEALASFYQTKLMRVENGGHDVTLDQPEYVLSLLQKILPR
ncbi:alpha/beta fold hydrolase [Shewanella donghaensis]|uniref:alpha/beta fold hydrolase n=1 Tax=Shewanella donghaensis TaxID=238836 RepID=UPI00118211E1|nr:alpha/beta hydrolase [Shewanella donghaensis]